MTICCHFILYVRDQDESTAFYREVLALTPRLHVPGMTEFDLGDNCILGLMPEKGIKRLLGGKIQDPEASNGISRAEVYLRLPEPTAMLERARAAGAPILSEMEARNWGDEAAYVMDPDGHVLAFARSLTKA